MLKRLAMIVLATSTFAQTIPLDLTPTIVEEQNSSPILVDAPAPVERNETLSQAHNITGFAAALLGLATALSAPFIAESDAHEIMGYTAAGFAAISMAGGFAAHHNEIGPQQGSSSNNMHAILGVLGGSMMVITPFLAPGGAHKVVGGTGAALMCLSVTWKIVF
ncbi:MAG TPA: hypothetical protein VLM37_06005 [Fibrobacteraceae bacterium]|nr:hypothetical protein [Fibrobacteraceae bacterium]